MGDIKCGWMMWVVMVQKITSELVDIQAGDTKPVQTIIIQVSAVTTDQKVLINKQQTNKQTKGKRRLPKLTP